MIAFLLHWGQISSNTLLDAEGVSNVRSLYRQKIKMEPD